MNIFVLDHDPETCAKYHTDRHVVKMILESAQMLCNCFDEDSVPYKRTHYNHSCSAWVRQSVANYEWLLQLAKYLCREYFIRYNKIHKTESVISSLMGRTPTNIPNIGLTPFTLTMPQQYRSGSATTSYRNYYLGEKQHLFSWKYRPTPYWVLTPGALINSVWGRGFITRLVDSVKAVDAYMFEYGEQMCLSIVGDSVRLLSDKMQ